MDKFIMRLSADIKRITADKNIAREIGTVAVKHYSENFDKEGFVNGGLQPWKDVKRRDPSSPWYGFDYKGEKRKNYPIRKGKSGKRLKRQKKLNYSNVATKRKILQGSTGELKRSLAYRVERVDSRKMVISISSDKKYAAIHNFGGAIRVFGKATVKLPARPFVGYSRELTGKINRIIQKNLFKK